MIRNAYEVPIIPLAHPLTDFQQTNGQQHSSRVSKYLPFFVIFILSFALYQVGLSLSSAVVISYNRL
jgi:hypothetical protein